MHRRFFTIVSAISLLLCAAALALWPRSYWAGDAFEISLLRQKNDPRSDFVPMDSFSTLCVRSGRALFAIGRGETFEQPGLSTHRSLSYWTDRPPFDLRDSGSLWRRFGFIIDSGPDGLMYFSFPLWIAVLIFAAIPTIQLSRGLRAKNVFHCTACSYNLTGNTSGICPECGTPVHPKAEATA